MPSSSSSSSSSSYSSSMKKIFTSGSVTFVVIRIVLVLILVFLVYIPKNVLSVFENFFFQAFYLLLMAYLALMDAPSGLLMATIFLFAIQQLNQHHKSSPSGSPSVALIKKGQQNQMMDKKSMGMDNSESERMMMTDVMQTLENEKLVDGVLTRRTTVEKQRNEVDMTSMFDNFDKLEHFEPTGGMDILDPSTHPAFKTMTENLAEDSNSFTTKMQFQDAGSNLIPGADPNVGIKAWKNGLGAQGLDLPNGYDKSDYYGSVF